MKQSEALNRARLVVRRLEELWPATQDRTAKQLLADLKTYFELLAPQRKAGAGFFDLLEPLRSIVTEQDQCFLGRQLSYNLILPHELPPVFGECTTIEACIRGVIATITQLVPRKSQIQIRIAPARVRQGEAIEVRFLMAGLEEPKKDRKKLLGLLEWRPKLYPFHARLWLEVGKEQEIALVLLLPTYDSRAMPASKKEATYKYDVWFEDFTKVRQRFGIERAEQLVMQVENFVRSLVRHPIDFVMAFPDEGLVTTIYESEESGSRSVRSRIAERLKKEIFRIGRKKVTPKFRYSLSQLK